MQRPASIRTSDEYITIPPIHVKRSPGNKKTPDSSDDELPLYASSSPSNGASKKETSRPRSSVSEKWVHVIPVILFICFFTLWWFSHPVEVVVKDGRIISVRPITEQLNNSTQGNQTTSSSVTQTEEFVRKEKEFINYAELKHLTSKVK